MAPTIEHVGVDHGGLELGVAEELLDGSDVVAGEEEMGGEGMPHRVGSGRLADPSVASGVLYGALDAAGVEVMAAALAAVAVDVEVRRREDELPAIQPGFTQHACRI